MHRPVMRSNTPGQGAKIPPPPPFPEFDVAKESIQRLSRAFEERRNAQDCQKRREPFEDLLQTAAEGMLDSVRKNMPL